jgi:hypothetical protein
MSAATGPKLRDPRDQRLGEGVEDAALHVDPVRADARLTGVEELDQRRTLGRVHRVGVVEHEHRGVTAQLHGDALHGGGGT